MTPRPRHTRLIPLLALTMSSAAAPVARAQPAPDPLAAIGAAMTAADGGLREGEPQLAESHYRSALMQGWLLLGGLELGAGRLVEARDAFRRAAASAYDAQPAIEALAYVLLQMGEPREAVALLTPYVRTQRGDTQPLRLLAQALIANGQPQEAVQELEEARGSAPDDAELTFMLASGYLRLRKTAPAERLFGEVLEARPQAATHVLVGRTYRDAGDYMRARQALARALTIDPRARRAHYYLGTLAVLDRGADGIDEAVAAFRRELALAPKDPAANLLLGIALVESQRHREALSVLEIAAAADRAPADAFLYLGRCLLALDRPADAATALRKALERVKQSPPDVSRLASTHYQLATALRSQGAREEAATHFAEAERLAARETDTARERLARYMAGASDEQAPAPLAMPAGQDALTDAQRQAVESRVHAALSRAYFNLGIRHAQASRFARAADFLRQAAAIHPEFPQLQYALGVAHFNAGEYAQAAPALERALSSSPAADVRRMLALSWFNTGMYAKAADLLRDEPVRAEDASLQYAYGVALVRSGRADEAQRTFGELIALHAGTPELHVVLGQAHAQQGDFDGAVAALRRAIELKPDVPEAHGTLGFIYLKQGRLTEAAGELRAELAHRPHDTSARHHLATVLDLDGRPGEAAPLLREILRASPEHADARYLLGKILLASGHAADAVDQLEAAARLAPEDANIHYQLGQAYQRLGRADQAAAHLHRYRVLKERKRGGTP